MANILQVDAHNGPLTKESDSFLHIRCCGDDAIALCGVPLDHIDDTDTSPLCPACAICEDLPTFCPRGGICVQVLLNEMHGGDE